MSSILDKLFEPTFKVQSLHHKNFEYPCRDLPNEVLLGIVSDLISTGNAEIAAARAKVLDQLVDRVRAEEDGALSLNLGKTEEIQNNLRLALPVLTALILKTDEYVHRILKSCLADSELEEEHVRLVPVNDAIAIVEQVFTRIDTDLLARKVGHVFSHAMGVLASSKPQEGEPKQS